LFGCCYNGIRLANSNADRFFRGLLQLLALYRDPRRMPKPRPRPLAFPTINGKAVKYVIGMSNSGARQNAADNDLPTVPRRGRR
jgi:hypothetical protein